MWSFTRFLCNVRSFLSIQCHVGNLTVSTTVSVFSSSLIFDDFVSLWRRLACLHMTVATNTVQFTRKLTDTRLNLKHWASAYLHQGTSHHCRDTDPDRHQNLIICSFAHCQFLRSKFHANPFVNFCAKLLTDTETTDVACTLGPPPPGHECFEFS